jgi:ABC-2 type transport system permease protein
MIRLLHAAFVIARRDFAATVLSKAFIFFLLGPIFPLLFGGLFGSIGASVATQAERPVVAVISSYGDFDRLSAARERVADALGEPGTVKLVHYAPDSDPAAQERRLLASKSPPVRAVLDGGLAKSHLTGTIAQGDPTAGQIRLIIEEARSPSPVTATIGITEVKSSSGSLAKDRALTAWFAATLLFVLTILLCGMVMSQLIEEKSNKIIEVIAAAVPIDSLFIGKLFAMLAASLVGIIVWVSAGALLVQTLSTGGIRSLPTPAVGWPVFLALGVVYFAMNYLLLGAVFLTIGAQASTAREVQTMSMPVTFGQMLIFGFAAKSIGSPDSIAGLTAAIFPLSSPLAMLARAAEQSEIWPHLIGILWQMIWVAVILRIGSRLFRKTVLKSGPRGKSRRWGKLKRA